MLLSNGYTFYQCKQKQKDIGLICRLTVEDTVSGVPRTLLLQLG